MGYKHVTIVVQDKWLKSQRKLGVETIDDLLRRFLRVAEWHWQVLEQ